MGKKQDESLKYMEGNYSNIWRLPEEFWEDVQQASEMMDAEEYWKDYMDNEKAAREEHHYLVEGALLTCTACTMKPVRPFKEEFTAPEGSSERQLRITEERKLLNGAGQRFATVKDRVKWENIEPFGNCKNPPNREKEIKDVQMAETSEELRKAGTCAYLMDIRDDWENLLGEGGYDSCPFWAHIEAAITMEAMIFCSHVGCINTKSSGYIPSSPLKDKEVYVRDILDTLGWPIDDEELKYLCGVLEDFGISDYDSIACFLLICVTETGPVGIYSDKLDRNGERYVDQYGRSVTEFLPIGEKRRYEFEERGVGYIQVTWRESQLECLKYLKDNGYWNGMIDENAAGYVKELRTIPWETSAWRWAVVKQTGEGNLNAYVTARATEGERGLTMGIFLAAESFINGKVEDGFSEPLGKIARGEWDWIYNPNRNTVKVEKKVEIKGKEEVIIEEYSAPNNWEKFEDNYRKLEEAGVI